MLFTDNLGSNWKELLIIFHFAAINDDWKSTKNACRNLYIVTCIEDPHAATNYIIVFNDKRTSL